MNITYRDIKKLFPHHTLSVADTQLVTGISKDTRTLQPGDLYIAIKGDVHDGHDYVDLAFKKGAQATLVQTGFPERNNLILAADTIKAMGELATYYRQKFSQPVIAITGSSGKTTTKEFLTHVLSQTGQVIATKGNLNNHIGVPLTIFSFADTAKFFVVEMGMNHLEEIRTLTRMTRPTTGIITNVGQAHLEGVGGTIDLVAKAKSELFEELNKDATAIVYNDCPFISNMDTCASKITYGFGPNSQIWADHIVTNNNETRFNIHYFNKSITLTIKLVGQHHVQNALAVFAVAYQLGLSTDAIIKGLESFEITLNRGQKISRGLITLIDDTYNANPSSMQAAFDSLTKEQAQAKTMAILGGMLELGEQAPELHKLVGQKAKTAGIDELFAYGENAQKYLEGFGYATAEQKKRFFTDHETLAEAVYQNIKNTTQETVILCKGSRGMTMEIVLKNLCEKLEK